MMQFRLIKGIVIFLFRCITVAFLFKEIQTLNRFFKSEHCSAALLPSCQVFGAYVECRVQSLRTALTRSISSSQRMY